jgi:hypothetical protein
MSSLVDYLQPAGAQITTGIAGVQGGESLVQARGRARVVPGVRAVEVHLVTGRGSAGR